MTQAMHVQPEPMLSPVQAEEARGWLADCGVTVPMTTGRVVSMLNRYYDGQAAGFIRDCGL